MTSPQDPLITPDDLALYLKDGSIDQDRAASMIADAQALCETVVSPLPDVAAVVVKRVAGRGYVTTTSSRAAQAQAAGSPYGALPGGLGGVWLSRSDKADLRRMAGGGGAFSVDLLGADYALTVAPWDSGVVGYNTSGGDADTDYGGTVD